MDWESFEKHKAFARGKSEITAFFPILLHI